MLNNISYNILISGYDRVQINIQWQRALSIFDGTFIYSTLRLSDHRVQINSF